MCKCMHFRIYSNNFSKSDFMYFRLIYVVGSDECVCVSLGVAET